MSRFVGRSVQTSSLLHPRVDLQEHYIRPSNFCCSKLFYKGIFQDFFFVLRRDWSLLNVNTTLRFTAPRICKAVSDNSSESVSVNQGRRALRTGNMDVLFLPDHPHFILIRESFLHLILELLAYEHKLFLEHPLLFHLPCVNTFDVGDLFYFVRS